MLTFNEGVPGAGKTYDAVKEHILPALTKGRTVYARLNGLNHDAIAEYLKLDVERVRELLIHVPSDQVVASFQTETVDGEPTIPDRFRNALIVIDEVHDFYVSDRKPLEKSVESFFALHRHYGMDILIMTQWYKRVHAALRARIERKNVFQKLTALGKSDSYRVVFWQTVSPDKYARVDGRNAKYDPAIFPLYAGIAEGDINTQVYEAGSTNVWKSILPWAIVSVVSLLIAGVFLFRFFHSSAASKALAHQKSGLGRPVESRQVYQQGAPAKEKAPPKPPTPQEVAKQTKEAHIVKMSSEQQYVWKLSDTARIRVAAIVGNPPNERGVIEWRPDQGQPLDTLTTAQLVAMGIKVLRRPYGFLLSAGGEEIVATQWATNLPPEAREMTTYCVDCGVTRDGSPASVASGDPSAARPGTTTTTETGYGRHADYGAMGVGG